MSFDRDGDRGVGALFVRLAERAREAAEQIEDPIERQQRLEKIDRMAEQQRLSEIARRTPHGKA